MTWVPYKPQPGVIRQATPYDVPNVWWDTNNVRWVSGAITPVGGNTRITKEPQTSKIRALYQWRDNGARQWTAIGTEDNVSVLFGVLTDVTPNGFVSMNAIAGGGFGSLDYGPDPTIPSSYADLVPIEDYSGTTVNRAFTVTITNASPAVVTWPKHGLTSDDVVKFSVSAGGSLPSGITAGQPYYVIPIDINTFRICLAGVVSPDPNPKPKNGTPINTTTAGSGTFTASQIVGQDTYGRQRRYNPPIFRKPDHWSFQSFGEDLLAVCSSDGRLLHLSPTISTVPVMDVPSNAPIDNYTVVVTAERAVMLLGAGGNPRRVQWSDFENYNSWTPTTTNQTGYIDLEAASPIINGIRVKEGVLVLTQHEAFLVRYVGAPYYYGVEKLGATTFTAPNGITSGGSQTVWFGEEGFWRYDGSSVRLLNCPFFNDIKQNYDPLYGNYRAHMHENGQFPEFWFEYPDIHSNEPGNIGECNNYVFWDYNQNIWGRGQRKRTASCGAVTASYPLASGWDGHVYQHEDGWLDGGRTRLGNVWAETSVLDVGQGSSNIDITQAMVAPDPDIGTQNYQIKFKTRYTPGQTETVFGPYAPRNDGYTDTRATGRDVRLRVEATNDAYWSFGQIKLDVQKSGGER